MQMRLQLTAIAVLSLFLVGQAATAEPGADKKYKVRSDLAYKQGGSDYERERCKLDLYLPIGRQDYPVMLWFHGGGLRAGDKGALELSRGVK